MNIKSSTLAKQKENRQKPCLSFSLVIVIVFTSCVFLLNIESMRETSTAIQLEYSRTVGGDSQFEMARSQSNGFFDDITNANWQKLKDIVAVHVDHKYPDKPLTHNPHFDKRKMAYFNSYPAWWQTNYEPNFSCQFERRIGHPNGNGDGPKWICDPHRIVRMAKERKAKDPNHPGCVIFSIGSNGDFSFESGMMNLLGNNTCEFHIFDTADYTEKMPKNIGRAYFHPWGISTQQDRKDQSDMQPMVDRRGRKFFGLKDTMKLLGLENLDTIDIFKIDCEGCEYDTFKDWIDPDLPVLQQIQVEIHNAKPNVIDFFDTLREAGYARFHKEPNIQFGGGAAVEYALIKLVPEFFPVKNKIVLDV